MNFDRNTVIGFLFLALLFMGYFYFNSQQQAVHLQQKAREDSIAKARMQPPAVVTTNQGDSVVKDSVLQPLPSGEFQQYARGSEQLQTIENDVFKIVFTNKGGQPKSVELKNYKAPDSTNVLLAASQFDQINYEIIPAQNTTTPITSLYFQPGSITKNGDGSSTISYSLNANGKSIVHQYVVKPGQYMIDFNIIINGVNQLFNNNTINFIWQNKAVQLQKDLSYERQQSQVSFMVEDEYDYESAMSSDRLEWTQPVSWVGVKQQFFNSTLIAKNKFSSGMLEWTAPQTGDQKTVVQATAHLKYTLPGTAQASVPLSLYYGPTEFKTLKQYDNSMEEMVNLGSGIFAFVKYINRWIILPVFDFLRTLTSNYGIVILLLTLFIRLLISPLTYSSYLSGAL